MDDLFRRYSIGIEEAERGERIQLVRRAKIWGESHFQQVKVQQDRHCEGAEQTVGILHMLARK